MNRTQEALLFLLRAGRLAGSVPAPPDFPHSPDSEDPEKREKSNLAPISSISSISGEEWPRIIKEADRHGLTPYLFQKFRAGQNEAGPFPQTSGSPHHKAAGAPQPVDVSSPAPQAIASNAPQPSPLTLSPSAPGIPSSALSALRQAYMRNSSVNLQRFHYLGIALRALSEAGAPVIVLKGGYLAETVYQNIAARVMCDVDILVRREHVSAAIEALRAAGFAPTEHCLEPPPDVNEFHFYHRKSRALLELHWELINSEYPYALKAESVWPDAVPARVASVDALGLSTEDLLCHLAVHAGIHSYNIGLKAFIDCAEIIDRLPIDWRRLVSRARLFHAVRPVWLYLTLARRLLIAAVPDGALAELIPSDYSESIVAAAIERVLPGDGERPSQEAGNPNLILLFGRKGVRAKLALGLRRAFPSRASIASLYPVRPNSPRVFLYYPKWIWALIRRNAPAIRARIASPPIADKADGGGKPAADSAALMDWLIRAE